MKLFRCMIMVLFWGCVVQQTNPPPVAKASEGEKMPDIYCKEGLLRRQGLTNPFAVYDEAPKVTKMVAPQYSADVRALGIEGSVVLSVEVFDDGTVGAVKVIESLLPGEGGMDEAAAKAVQQWQFQPAMCQGKPVSCWICFPLDFSLH